MEARAEAEPLPLRSFDGRRIGPNDRQVMKCQKHARIVAEAGVQRRQLLRFPNVVLIAGNNHVPLAEREGFGKVLRDAEPGRVHAKRDLEVGPFCKLADEGGRLIVGAVITHDQLVGEPRLRADALELMGQKGLAVIGA